MFQHFLWKFYQFGVVYQYPSNRYTMHIEPIIRFGRKALHFCNPCGIYKLDNRTPGSPLLCICLNFLYNNLKEKHSCWRWYYIWSSKLSYTRITPKNIFFFAQSSFENLFITHFLLEPPTPLKKHVEVCSYLLHNNFKWQYPLLEVIITPLLFKPPNTSWKHLLKFVHIFWTKSSITKQIFSKVILWLISQFLLVRYKFQKGLHNGQEESWQQLMIALRYPLTFFVISYSSWV